MIASMRAARPPISERHNFVTGTAQGMRYEALASAAQKKYLRLTLCQTPHAACCCSRQWKAYGAAAIGFPVRCHQYRALEALF